MPSEGRFILLNSRGPPTRTFHGRLPREESPSSPPAYTWYANVASGISSFGHRWAGFERNSSGLCVSSVQGYPFGDRADDAILSISRRPDESSLARADPQGELVSFLVESPTLPTFSLPGTPRNRGHSDFTLGSNSGRFRGARALIWQPITMPSAIAPNPVAEPRSGEQRPNWYQ
ncbi:hypothetical protein KM043_000343 [Ampulex compressa]|nr:hypothetical protein KM043_000343 [Ampulex compressa]